MSPKPSRWRIFKLAVGLSAALGAASPCLAYGVLSHEALVDQAWEQGIVPIIERRFPGTSADVLQECRAYAYGGCIMPDMGYYPFGSKLFTDLVHYVHSGDFVLALIDEARSPQDLAFALGALAHHCADREGHSIGINRVVPLVYPKLRKKYGDEVTYDEKPSAHLKVEFSFDVLHIARGKYLPKNYHDFIGFEVAKEPLERAFQRVYGLELKEVIPNVDLAIGSFRRTASRIIPKMTEAAWEAKKDEILKTAPQTQREQYVYSLARADYEKEWGKGYREPGPLAKFVALVVKVLPKVGPLQALAFQVPTPEEEQRFDRSFEAAAKALEASLADVRRGAAPDVEEVNLDTGQLTQPGSYSLADAAYAELLVKLAKRDFDGASPELLADLRKYHADRMGASPKQGHGHGPSRKKVERALEALARVPDSTPLAAAGGRTARR